MLQPANFARIGETPYLEKIGFGMLETRMGQTHSELAVVGQQQQPFAVLIQPPYSI